MKSIKYRATIYPKDVSRITGKSESYGRKLLQKIRKQLSKGNHQYITIEEFAQYTGVTTETIKSYISD